MAKIFGATGLYRWIIDILAGAVDAALISARSAGGDTEYVFYHAVSDGVAAAATLYSYSSGGAA